ncbi:MAG: hypothetical protein U0441_12885 [Polyangiaceae bacterium]
MRLGPVLLVLACGLAAVPAGAQTCPPNDPLCTKDSAGKQKPKFKSDQDAQQKSQDDAKPPADDQNAVSTPKPAEAPAKPVESPPKSPPAKAAEAAPRGVITLAEVTITGRVQKPIAAVDVGRINPHLTLTELRQPFLDRIEKVIYSDPF